MLELIERLAEDGPVSDTLVLPFDTRQKSRFRSVSTSGVELAVLLPRGTILRGGDRLTSADGVVVAVHAAREAVAEARSEDPQALLRAAYHLGNRHIRLQIEPGRLRFQSDHVLEDMLRSLGVVVTTVQAPFEPEAGAYAQAGHGGHGGHHHPHEGG